LFKKQFVASRLLFLLATFIFTQTALYPQEQDSSSVQEYSFLTHANQVYQSKVGSKTIHRCPFEISCSKFLRISVEKHGAVKGFTLFLDRYFYRENTMIPHNYEAVVKNNKVVYRDDIPDSLITYLYHD